jgi:hypothetical protein
MPFSIRYLRTLKGSVVNLFCMLRFENDEKTHTHNQENNFLTAATLRGVFTKPLLIDNWVAMEGSCSI